LEKEEVMKKNSILFVIFVLALIPSILFTMPTVYPTGTTIYKPDKAWNGYTVFDSPGAKGAVLIDMNGNVLRFWKGLRGSPASNKLLPGGYVYGSTGGRKGHQEFTDLSLVDWQGNIVWQFHKTELIKDPGQKPKWYARLHHDYQDEGNPVGYYVPGIAFKKDGNRLILSHKNVKNPKLTDKILEDDLIIEVNNKGEIIWEWLCSDHFDEFGFDDDAKKPYTATRITNAGPKSMTGCTSIAYPGSGPTNGMTRATKGSIPTTSSSMAGRPIS
jgi:hypothetical protein